MFHTRWALSYLAGPIMRNRFKELIGDQESAESSEGASAGAEATVDSNVGTRPVLDPDIPQVFIPGPGDFYRPSVIGIADVLYDDTKLNINESRDQIYSAEVDDYVDWKRSEPSEYGLDDLENEPRDGYGFEQFDAEVSKKEREGLVDGF